MNPFGISGSDDVLLRSIQAQIPTHSSTHQYAGYISESGYFIGTKRAITLIPTTEYTIQLDAFYRKPSGSVNLIGVDPKVDIYLIGSGSTKIIDNNPLGQKLGTLSVTQGADTQWFRDAKFNFNPALADIGNVGLRLVVNNGFWNFSEISLVPASDNIFSPDEVQFLVPNHEYYNELLQYKIEFFDINNNSTEVSAISTPTFFTGSNIDLGTLP